MCLGSDITKEVHKVQGGLTSTETCLQNPPPGMGHSVWPRPSRSEPAERTESALQLEESEFIGIHHLGERQRFHMLETAF